MIGLSLLLSSALALAPAPHPVSNYRAKLVLTDDSTEIVVWFSYDDVAMLERVFPDRAGLFDPADIRTAFEPYEHRLVEGTRLYDGDGNALPLESSSLSGDHVPKQALNAAQLLEWKGAMRLRFPAIERPEDASILIDWGCWRESVSTSITTEFEVAGGRRGRMYWQERQRYPLLPREGDDLVGYGGEEIYLVRPLEETLTGFSYIYIEPDHVRHELVLPLLAIGALLGEEMEASTTDLLGTEQREVVAKVLLEEYGKSSFLWSDERELPAKEAIVRWFTRDSIRQGIVTGDRPIPIATGFVGVLSVHPIAAPIDQLTFDARPWRRYVTDQVVTVLHGDETQRWSTSEKGSKIYWQGWAREAEPVAVTTVPASAAPRMGWAPWVAGGCTVLAAIAALRRKWRSALLLLAGAAAIGATWCHRIPTRAPSPARDREVVAALLENVYRACGRQDEHEALELLSAATEGSLLEQLYLELRGQLRGPWATGAGTRVTGVSLDGFEASISAASEIAGRCTWTMQARIEHWGHVHERALRVTGRVRAEAEARRWRLAELRLVDKQIVAASSRPRR